MTSPRSDIVVLGDIRWDGTWMSRHQITRRLAHRHRVLVAAPPRYRPWGDRLRRWHERAAPVDVAPNLAQLAPAPWIPPAPRADLKGRAAAWARARWLTAAWRELGLRDPLLYVWEPDEALVLDHLPDLPVIYHCYDHYAQYSSSDARDTAALHARLLSRASRVLASSSRLVEELAAQARAPVCRVDHAVDFDLFHEGGEAADAEDVRRAPRPRLGYVGSINEKLDLALLDALAEHRPDWSIVLIGQPRVTSPAATEALARAAARPNVYLLPARPQQQVPACLREIDVGLLPYKPDSWMEFGQPLKLYEYFAAGLPVVASRIPATEELGSLLALASRADDWVTAIEATLASDTPAARAARVEFARSQSWDRRVEEVERHIEEVRCA